MGSHEPSSSEPSPLVKELTAARVRGLDRLDGITARKTGPLALPLLRALADSYVDEATPPGATAIAILLREALAHWSKKGMSEQSRFVRDCFFSPDGSTTGLTEGAQKRLKENHTERLKIKSEQWDVLRAAHFESFAYFLPSFVEEVVSARRAQDDREEESSPATATEQTSGDPEPVKDSESRKKKFWIAAAAMGFVLAATTGVVVAVLAVGTDSNDSEEPGGGGGTEPSRAINVQFTFDDLGSDASPIISVYPGVGDSDDDKTPSATFASGQSAPALCQTTGRIIRSDPSAGEEDRQSDIWIKVEEQSGLTHYASLTYSSLSPADLDLLPSC